MDLCSIVHPLLVAHGARTIFGERSGHLMLYDGDTLWVKADIWPNLTHIGKVRVRGVDTPEKSGAL